MVSCLLAQPFVQARIKENTKAPRTGLFEGNPPVTGGFPSRRASNTEMFPFDDVIKYCLSPETKSTRTFADTLAIKVRSLTNSITQNDHEFHTFISYSSKCVTKARILPHRNPVVTLKFFVWPQNTVCTYSVLKTILYRLCMLHKSRVYLEYEYTMAFHETTATCSRTVGSFVHCPNYETNWGLTILGGLYYSNMVGISLYFASSPREFSWGCKFVDVVSIVSGMQNNLC